MIPLHAPGHGDGASHKAPVCPECAQGKHGACDGSAWNYRADDLDACACHRNRHNAARATCSTCGRDANPGPPVWCLHCDEPAVG